MTQTITFYKIYCKEDPNQFYIGSTKNFSGRKSHHKKNVKNRSGKLYWCKLYQFIREKGGWDNFEMIRLYTDTFNTKEDRNHDEQCIINISNPPLNSSVVVKIQDPDLFEYTQKFDRIKKLLKLNLNKTI